MCGGEAARSCRLPPAVCFLLTAYCLLLTAYCLEVCVICGLICYLYRPYTVVKKPRMTPTIHLLRHGQTALSRDDVFCGSGLDPELTREGLEMAQAFAATYRTKPWRAIYS